MLCQFYMFLNKTKQQQQQKKTEELSNQITMQKGQGISTLGKLPAFISRTEGSASHCYTWLLQAGNRGGDDGGLHQFFPPPTLLP